MDSWRNRVAQWIANLALNNIATDEYRKYISGAINYGMAAAVRDTEEGITPPKPWDEYVHKEET